VGFEPTTNALKGHCSTAELPTQIKGRGYVLSGWRLVIQSQFVTHP